MIGSVYTINNVYGTPASEGVEIARQVSQTGQVTPVQTEQSTTSQTGQSSNDKKNTRETQQIQAVNPNQQTEETQKNSSESSGLSKGLTKAEMAAIQELARMDQKVRAHEQAHISVGGNLVRGGANYDYSTGPDNKRYAVAGEVSIDTSEVSDDPEATKQKAEHIRRTALAPADPSGQDLRVAAAASNMILEAQAEIRQAANEELTTEQAESKPVNQEEQKISSPILEAMLKEAYGNAQNKSTDTSITSILVAMTG